MAVSEKQVLDALGRVIDPDLGKDIVSLGFIKDLSIRGSAVSFKVELTTPACPVKDQLKEECLQNVSKIPAVSQVDVEMTARVWPKKSTPEEMLSNIKHCVAIASGKGGVGKSTLTVNLAIALAQKGAKVGLLDADVYGPSIPLMMGCVGQRPYTRNEKIQPIEKFGIQIMSLGFLLEEGQAVLWRGPMVAGTVKQLLFDVEWGNLDYLLVDLPPGTGDAPMSLAQLAPLTGVVIISTPHSVASNIAGKAAALFERLNTPLLGVVENMAEYVCPCCENRQKIFSGFSGEALAESLKTSFLGSIPLDPCISNSSSDGAPSIITDPQRPQAISFKEIAGKLAAQISIRAAIDYELKSPKEQIFT